MDSHVDVGRLTDHTPGDERFNSQVGDGHHGLLDITSQPVSEIVSRCVLAGSRQRTE